MDNYQDNQPLLKAVLLFFILFVTLVVATIMIDFSKLDLIGLLFLATFACCAMISKSVYDSLMVNEQIARTEEQISEGIAIASQELHTQLYQNSPIPYMLLDENGTVTSANLAAGRLYGSTYNNLISVPIFETFLSDKNEHIDVLVEKYRNGISASSELVRVLQKNGGEAWVLLSLYPYVNAYGEKIGLLTLVDITKQKQIENAKAEFVSLASHQLRTPIAGIKWSAELLYMDPDNTLTDMQKKYVARLLLSVKRMAILVDDFLRVSRFELGTFQPEYTDCDLKTLVQEVIDEQRTKIKQKDIDIQTFFDDEIDCIVTDQNLVRMIVTNLFSNAVKYTKPHGTVHIGYTKKDELIHLSVADNGMGIPVSEQDHIFSKLFRASNAARNVPDGNGLGLYIIKEAVNVLKGKISFVSAESMGTTFDVYLPLRWSQKSRSYDHE